MSTQTFDQLPLGLTHGQVVMEIGLDSDCDDSIRDAFVAAIGQELLDEDSDEIVEAILLWWRDDDGDLVDGLMDALGPLADNGVIWLLTPKAGRDGHIEPSEISEAAPDRRAATHQDHQREPQLAGHPTGHPEVEPPLSPTRPYPWPAGPG